jgi:hypothetical protein
MEIMADQLRDSILELQKLKDQNYDDERTKTDNQDDIRESHLDGEGVLVGND